MTNLTDASCRVAFAALIHDLGKFAERAKIEISEDIKDRNKHTFCPKNYETQLYTHIHAAYTGIAFDQIEAFLPPVKNVDTFPFQIDQIDDSLETAAAKHHAPCTYLQHVISMADRLSSAFERTKYEEYNQQQEKGDYQTSRLVSLFEKLKGKDLEYTYPLKALSPHAIFPNLKSAPTKEQATLEYRELWNDFVRDIKKIKNRENWDLWLDAFDTLYATYTQNIPSASYRDIPDVSLYDHSKSTAALATALWRYHNETQTETLDNLKKDDKKFLLIQGDVSGIQNFIFDVGKKSRKYAYKMLRGRSFFVSLFSECAALRILKALDLPSTSQIMNAAGKFVIVAPNTSSSRQKVKALSKEFDQWFLSRQYAQISVGIATLEVTSQDFEQKNFGNLQERIYKSLSLAKMQKFNLCSCNGGIIKQFEEHYI
jgi:CRISPR-associated protein Csm1